MKLSDLVELLVIDSRKLTAYALNPNSPRGKDKAVVFEKVLGYTDNNYDELLKQLERKPLDCEAFFHGEDRFGKRYTERGLFAGAQGAVVHCHREGAYEVEFTNEHGETTDFLALWPEQFIVIWSAATQEWVALSERVSALLKKMPQERAQEVFDFARFLSSRDRIPSLEKAA